MTSGAAGCHSGSTSTGAGASHTLSLPCFPVRHTATPIRYLSTLSCRPDLFTQYSLRHLKTRFSRQLFKGLYPLYGKKKPENGASYYYTGIFRVNEDARQALSKVRAAGFSDAFVIAMMDDTQVSMERAAMLEKEWAAKPLPVKELMSRRIRNHSILTLCLSEH